MDDYISREAVLDMLEDINNHIIDGYGYKHDWCVEWVKGLPSIDAEPQWIPVTDRLPSYFEDVLLSFGKNFNVGYLISANDETESEWFCSGWYFPMSEVDAWMPLPEPYERKEETCNNTEETLQ